MSTVTERRYGVVGAFVAKVIRPSPEGLRRLLPRLIIGLRPVAPPNGFSREPCGNVPWSKPGMTSCSTSVRVSAATAVTVPRRSCPGLRAVSARVRVSGVYQWLQPRINRYPTTAPTNPSTPTLCGLTMAGTTRIARIPSPLVAGSASGNARASMRITSSPRTAQISMTIPALGATGVLSARTVSLARRRNFPR